MIINAFGEEKDIMEWLEDLRIDPEVTRDVLSKRVSRDKGKSITYEKALTTPVNKGAMVGDNKERTKAREDKLKRRIKMFLVSKKVRKEYGNGVSIEEIMERNQLSKSQVNKISGKQEWYNIHWDKSNPKKFSKIIKEIKESENDKG